MKICAAQTKSKVGDIPANLQGHKKWIRLAAAQGAELVVFPELSLTGYEPALAGQLSIEPGDQRIQEFQALSNDLNIIIGAGAPIKSSDGILISLLLFRPNKALISYSKGYLHPDEEAYFICGHDHPLINLNGQQIAFAICYEISIQKHLEQVGKGSPLLYIASVAKFGNGIDAACTKLSSIAREHSIPVLMTNSVGPADGGLCAGNSSAWSNEGTLLGKLNDSDEGLLMYDTSSLSAWITGIDKDAEPVRPANPPFLDFSRFV